MKRQILWLMYSIMSFMVDYARIMQEMDHW
jgi:hypothetical protein